MQPTIVFIRHGQTEWNVQWRLQGQRDIPLNAIGREQARQNGIKVIATVPGVTAYDFVSSPLGRARETMEIARAAMGLDPLEYRVDDDLRELTFGEWEGFTLAELRKTQAELVAARAADKWKFLPPGGESYFQLSERIATWVKTVNRDTVAVSHGGVGRVLVGMWTDMEPADIVAMDFPQDQFLLWKGGKATWI